MKFIRTLIARRRLAKLLRPDPLYRQNRLAQFNSERRARALEMANLSKPYTPRRQSLGLPAHPALGGDV